MAASVPPIVPMGYQPKPPPNRKVNAADGPIEFGPRFDWIEVIVALIIAAVIVSAWVAAFSLMCVEEPKEVLKAEVE